MNENASFDDKLPETMLLPLPTVFQSGARQPTTGMTYLNSEE